jgi:type I restriction-modification system DNA methylase subunit
MEEYKKKIVEIIGDMSGQYSPYEIFTDWVLMSAISIQNNCLLIRDRYWQQREKMFNDTASKYSSEEMERFSEMLEYLTMALDGEIKDFMGEIYMESGCGNKNTGQFFTPFQVSLAAASLMPLDDVAADRPLTIHEPSVGSGGNILACARLLKDKGINYQRCMDVVAQDLDWKGVYMTYVQLSLLGIKALVVQGDTLVEPYTLKYPGERVMVTPGKAGMLI